MSFKYGLFGCFNNLGLCIVTYVIPCYTYGKNAEAVGESCLLCGLAYFIPAINFVFHTFNRGKIRQKYNIDGSFLTDCLVVWFCPCCALMQEAQEIQSPPDSNMDRM